MPRRRADVAEQIKLLRANGFLDPVQVWNQYRKISDPLLRIEEIYSLEVAQFRKPNQSLWTHNYQVKITALWGHLDFSVSETIDLTANSGNQHTYHDLQVISIEHDLSSPQQSRSPINLSLPAHLEEDDALLLRGVLNEMKSTEHHRFRPASSSRPAFRRKAGKVTYSLAESEFVCECWMPGDRWCEHINIFFRDRRDIEFVYGLTPGTRSRISLPLAFGYTYVPVLIHLLDRTDKSVIIMVDDFDQQNTTSIAQGESLLDGLLVLMDQYLASQIGLKVIQALIDNTYLPCPKGARHLGNELPTRDRGVAASHAYCLTVRGMCAICVSKRAVSFQQDVPEL